MKKILIVLLACLVLTAGKCGNDKPDPDKNKKCCSQGQSPDDNPLGEPAVQPNRGTASPTPSK